MKLNKYQKLLLILYGTVFIYFSAIHAPFKIDGSDEIVYDTVFSQRANLDISRLLLILIILSFTLALMFILLSNLQLTIKKPLMQRLKTKHKIYILLLIAFIGITIIFWRKNHTTLPIVEAFSSDTTIVLTNRKGAPDKGIDTEKYKPSIYTIINVKFYSKDNFEEFVAFTFLNTSTEIITNIMFEESHYRIKKKTSDFTNKKLILKPKDSINFTFKKNHDKLFVQKIRFATGKTITFEDELFNDDNTIYDKLWERKN